MQVEADLSYVRVGNEGGNETEPIEEADLSVYRWNKIKNIAGVRELQPLCYT